jgi:1-acyl-sn-glycerol-3-phosphate acyltransferase
MLSILRKVWAIYAVILFLIMMLVSIPILLSFMIITPGQRALKSNIHYLYHIFTPIFLTLIGVRLQITGQECIDVSRPSVIIGNHRSALDFIVNAHAWPGIFRFLAKSELLKIPIFGWVVGKMCLIVDRSNGMSRARSMVALKQEIQSGWSVFIYPEGSRNTTQQALTKFYDGAFRIALQSGAPIVMVVIQNISDIAASGKSLDLGPGVLRIKYCGLIETSGLDASSVDLLKDQAFDQMYRTLTEK